MTPRVCHFIYRALPALAVVAVLGGCTQAPVPAAHASPQTTADPARATEDASTGAVTTAAGAPDNGGTGDSAASDDTVTFDVSDGLAGYPTLDAAVQARNAAHRQAFDAARTEARTQGIDTSSWSLRIGWRGIAGNRYLRLLQGNGEVSTAGAQPAIVTERVTYDGISKQVLKLGDWFNDDAVWPVLRAQADAAINAETTYEPVFSADGPVMGFDLLVPATSSDPASGEMRTVRIPLAAVDMFIDPRWRQTMSALAGGP